MTTATIKCPIKGCAKVMQVKETSGDQPVNCAACGFNSPLSGFQKLEKATCPKCQMTLLCPVGYKGVVVCPKCKHKGNNMNEFLEDPNKTTDPNKTQVGVDSNKMYKPGVLVLQSGVCKPARIELKRGVNPIGRKSKSGEGLLETDDMYMGRKHLNVEVVYKSDATFEHRLADVGSTNGTWHNDEKLEKDDIVILSVGDRVRIGRTVFGFEAAP